MKESLRLDFHIKPRGPTSQSVPGEEKALKRAFSSFLMLRPCCCGADAAGCAAGITCTPCPPPGAWSHTSPRRRLPRYRCGSCCWSAQALRRGRQTGRGILPGTHCRRPSCCLTVKCYHRSEPYSRLIRVVPGEWSCPFCRPAGERKEPKATGVHWLAGTMSSSDSLQAKTSSRAIT